jgi:hypothetical protein
MKALALTTLLLSLQSCCTIVGGGDQSLLVSSNPPGAAVYMESSFTPGQSVHVGNTPTTVVLKRATGNKTISVELDGQTQSAVKTQNPNPLIFGNIIFGGFIGLIIDGVSGNFTIYDTTPLVFDFEPKQ